MNKLRLKIKKFCLEYVKDMNGTRSAIRAGYAKSSAPQTACALLKNAQVKAEIERLLKQAEEQSGITVEFVLKGFKEVIERCLQRKPVMVMRLGRPVQATEEVDQPNGDVTLEGVWTFDANGANRALEMLGRYKAMFNDQKPEQGNTVIINYVKHRDKRRDDKSL